MATSKETDLAEKTLDRTPRRAQRRTTISSVLFWGVLCTLAVGVAGGVWYLRQLDEEIRRHTERLFAERFPHLQITIQGARLRTGEGISIRNVSIVRPARVPSDRRSEPVFVEELFLHCPVTLDQLMRRQLDISLVTIRRPILRLECRGDGTWDLSDLIPTVGGGIHPAPVRIEDGTLHVDDHRHAPVRTYRLQGIHVKLVPKVEFQQPGGKARLVSISVEGALSGEVFHEATVRGFFDVATGNWKGVGELHHLQLSPELEQAFPWPRPIEFWQSLHGRADADFRWELAGQHTRIDHFLIDGNLRGGEWTHTKLPFPLTGIAAQIHVDRDILSIQQGKATYGHATLEFSVNLRQNGGTPEGTVQVAAQNLLFDRELADLLPPFARDGWERYRPVGLLNTKLTLEKSGDRWLPQGEVVCQDVSILAKKFPYPVDHLHGRVRLGTTEAGEPILELERLRGMAATSPVELQGTIWKPGPEWYGNLTIVTEKSVPVDDRLISALGALSAKSQEVVRRFHATGEVEVNLHLERQNAPQSPIRPELYLTFSRTQIQHDVFPYPLRNVKGTLKMIDGLFSWAQVKAENDSAGIEGSGSWRPGLLNMRFDIDDLTLEEELLRALPPSSQRLWRNLQPRGVVDKVAVFVEHRQGDLFPHIDLEAYKLPPSTNLVGREIALQPTWFPFPLDDVTGELRLDRQGLLQLRNMTARHGATSVKLPEAKGEVQRDGRWKISLQDLRAERVRLDRELLAAVPVCISQPLTALQIQGPPVDVVCKAMTVERPSPWSEDLFWDWDVEVNGTGIRLGGGMPLRDVTGAVRFSGRRTPQEIIQRGELHVDSMMFHKMQFTEIHGPFQVAGPHLLFGSWPHGGTPGAPAMTAKAFRGTLQWQGQLSLDDQRRLDMQMAYSDGDLQELALQFNAAAAKDIRGRIFGDLGFTMHGGSIDSLTGQGNLRLRQADLYQLPFVVSLLSILSNKQPDSTAFTSSNVQYHLLGDQVLLDYIDFEGDAISLRGNGVVGFDRSIKLSLYSIVGRMQNWRELLPLVSEAAKRFMEIEIRGTLDNPEMKTTVLPVIDDTVKRLFPDPTADAQTTSPGAKPQR